MAKIASILKKRTGDKLREIEHSLGYANYETHKFIKELVRETPSMEIVLGTKKDIFDDPENFLCIDCDPIDGISQTWGSGPCPGYVYGVKLNGGSDLKLMVMFSNGETAETSSNMDVFESLFLAKQLINKL